MASARAGNNDNKHSYRARASRGKIRLNLVQLVPFPPPPHFTLAEHLGQAGAGDTAQHQRTAFCPPAIPLLPAPPAAPAQHEGRTAAGRTGWKVSSARRALI